MMQCGHFLCGGFCRYHPHADKNFEPFLAQMLASALIKQLYFVIFAFYRAI